MTERLKMTVELDVTVPQALALQAMFKHWNRLASWGASRMISFYVDGDGNFKPNCKFSFSEELPELTEELEKAAVCNPEELNNNGSGDLKFDYDPIAWRLHKLNETSKVQSKPAVREELPELKVTDSSEAQHWLAEADEARAGVYASSEQVESFLNYAEQAIQVSEVDFGEAQHLDLKSTTS